jgi:hypothetical protein
MATSLTTDNTQRTGSSESLANWVGPYATQMLGQANAYAAQPYAVYQGPLTAWSSPLQEQAFQGLGSLQTPSTIGAAAERAGEIGTQAMSAGADYGPSQFTTGIFNTEAAQQYMNPYLQTALNPMMDEARRQAEISRMNDAARLTQAGAYGGGRQAIMESEGNRNLMTKQNEMLTQGYNTAFDKAAGIFSSDQARKLQADQASEGSRQFGANFGLGGLDAGLRAVQTMGNLGALQNTTALGNINAQLQGGQTQRDIESEGVKADYNEFLQQRDYPMKMLQFKQSMLQGLPIGSVSYQQQQPSSLTNILNTAGGLMDLYDTHNKPK